MKKYFFLLALSLFTKGFSQNYKPVDTTYSPAKIKTFQGFLESRNENLGKDLKNLNLRNKNTVSDITSSRKKMFEEMIKEKTFFFDEPTENYIQGLLDRIVQKNNLRIAPQKVLLSRETNPNAVSLGDGLYIFNISTVNRMNSEDELSYILSHELGHYLLKHLQTSLTKNDLLKNSEAFKSKLKTARKSRGSGAEKMLSLLKEYEYTNKKNSRLHEIQADSLGYILFKSVARNPKNAIESLKKLDSIAPLEIAVLNTEDYKHAFQTPTLKFNGEWLEIYGENQYNYKSSKTNALGIHRDSLLSHPEIEERMMSLKKKFGRDFTAGADPVTPEFQNFKLRMRNETLYSYYVQKEYGRGLYFALQIQKIEPDNPFVKKMKGLFFRKLTEARKEHTYKRFVDNVNQKQQTEPYYRFLAILDNLSTSELENLSTFYNQ